MTMPLRAITETLGEAGLRDRFRLEIAALPPPDRAAADRALTLAALLHRHDRRVREPYLNHLLRVAIRIIAHYHLADPELIAAALLHDAVEDHPQELAGLPAGTPYAQAAEAALDVLADRFGPRVAELVRAVTNPPFDPAGDRDAQYRAHVVDSLDRHPWARVLKVSDFTDNAVGVGHTSGAKALSSAAKYRPLVPVFRELIGRPDTPLSAEAKRRVYRQLDLAEERFAAILDH